MEITRGRLYLGAPIGSSEFIWHPSWMDGWSTDMETLADIAITQTHCNSPSVIPVQSSTRPSAPPSTSRGCHQEPSFYQPRLEDLFPIPNNQQELFALPENLRHRPRKSDGEVSCGIRIISQDHTTTHKCNPNRSANYSYDALADQLPAKSDVTSTPC